METADPVFWGMDTPDLVHAGILVLTFFAILLGPIVAIQITRALDKKRDERERRIAIFRGLMRTRQMRLAHDHVGALNLIQLEFYGDDDVVAAYKEYINHLNMALPSPDEQERFFRHRDDLFVDLVCAIGKLLNYSFDKRDLGRLAYAPVGWERDENRQRYNQLLLTELLEGKRSLPIAPLHHGGTSAFPPPPKDDC